MTLQIKAAAILKHDFIFYLPQPARRSHVIRLMREAGTFNHADPCKMGAQRFEEKLALVHGEVPR